jgi:hypothetical protein
VSEERVPFLYEEGYCGLMCSDCGGRVLLQDFDVGPMDEYANARFMCEECECHIVVNIVMAHLRDSRVIRYHTDSNGNDVEMPTSLSDTPLRAIGESGEAST